jgi:hypothetical protein
MEPLISPRWAPRVYLAAAAAMELVMLVPTAVAYGGSGAAILWVAAWGSLPIGLWLGWAWSRLASRQHLGPVVVGTLLLLWQLFYLGAPDMAASSSTGALVYLALPLYGTVGVAVAIAIAGAAGRAMRDAAS